MVNQEWVNENWPKINHVSEIGRSLIANIGAEEILMHPNGHGMWLPVRQPTIPQLPAPEPEPEPEPEPPVTPDPGTPGTPSGNWTHPLPGAALTSPYGPRSFDGFHAGADLSTTAAAVGAPILAPCDMKITVALEAGGAGLPDAGSFVKGHTVSGNQYTWSFFHMAAGSLRVREGQTVAAGAELGREGGTGNVTGTHLHLECWPGHKTGGFRFDGPWYYGDGTPIDPLPVLRANGVNI